MRGEHFNRLFVRVPLFAELGFPGGVDDPFFEHGLKLLLFEVAETQISNARAAQLPTFGVLLLASS